MRQNNVESTLKNTACECVDWFHLARNKFQTTGSSGQGDEASSSVQTGEFMDQICNYQLLQKDKFMELIKLTTTVPQLHKFVS